jgi:hypothetical protein
VSFSRLVLLRAVVTDFTTCSSPPATRRSLRRVPHWQLSLPCAVFCPYAISGLGRPSAAQSGYLLVGEFAGQWHILSGTSVRHRDSHLPAYQRTVIEREDAPDCVRGDFIPPKIPLYKQRVGHMRMSGNNVPTYTMQVVAEARKLPDRWARVSHHSLIYVDTDPALPRMHRYMLPLGKSTKQHSKKCRV